LIQAVDRALVLLELVADSTSPRTVRELATASGLGRSTAYRLLATLEHRGLVERDPERQTYRLGYAALLLAARASDHSSLVRRARPILEELSAATGETVNLSVPVPGGTVAIDQVDSPHPVRLINYVGVRLPLHCTSNGKLLLAEMGDEALERFLASPLERRTERTMVEPARVRRQVTAARQRGFGITLGELDDSINGISVAIADSRGDPVAFLSVSGPAYRLTEKRALSLVDQMRKASEEVAAQVGWRG
jgi:DNA-binding IclR family transcriptional regulator